MKLVNFEEVSHRADEYLQIYNACGAVAFEIPEQEYFQLTRLTKWYQQNRDAVKGMNERQLGEIFDSLDVQKDSRIIFIFGFLMLVWDRNTKIQAERKAGSIQFTVRNLRIDGDQSGS